jgi:hypothetical protein
VFSEVCIPRKARCLHAPLLYTGGLVVLRDHTNHVCGVAATVYRRERCPQRFGQKLDSEDGRERSGRGILETHLCVGNARCYISMKLPDRELNPREGFLVRGPQQEIGGNLCASRYLGKTPASSKGSLHLYRPLLSAFTFVYLN